MILLLDTNAFIWLLDDSPKLGRTARSDLDNFANQLYISSISLLECAIKIRTDKLRLRMDFLAIEAFLKDAGIQMLQFDAWTAQQYIELPSLAWKDPFDAAIVAQAVAKRIMLVTSDHHILESAIPGLRLLDARR